MHYSQKKVNNYDLKKKKKKRERENAQLENTDVITLYPNRAIEQKKRSEYFKLWEHGFGLERERERSKNETLNSRGLGFW